MSSDCWLHLWAKSWLFNSFVIVGQDIHVFNIPKIFVAISLVIIVSQNDLFFLSIIIDFVWAITIQLVITTRDEIYPLITWSIIQHDCWD